MRRQGILVVLNRGGALLFLTHHINTVPRLSLHGYIHAFLLLIFFFYKFIGYQHRHLVFLKQLKWLLKTTNVPL